MIEWLYGVQDGFGRQVTHARHLSPDLVCRTSPHSSGGVIVQLVDPADERVVAAELLTTTPAGLVLHRWDAGKKLDPPVQSTPVVVP